MKVSRETLEVMRAGIAPFDTEFARCAYRERRIPRWEAVKDIDTRYRWDLYWAWIRTGGVDRDLFTDLSSAHIDTALRKIVPPLGE